MPTAQSKLSLYNRRYLSLCQQIEQEKRRFHYPVDLVNKRTDIRNAIVEMQNSASKEVDVI